MRDSSLFKHFWTVLAAVGTAGEWTLATTAARGAGVELPLAAHAVGPLLLFTLHRTAGALLERERTVPAAIRRASGALLATGLAACGGAGALAVTALGWAGIGVVAMLPAEASGLAVEGASAFGPPFGLLATCASGLAMLVVARGYASGWRRLVVTERTVVVRHLPPGLDGLRVLHVSDLHVGPLADRAAVREAIRRANELDADLVCVTGDIVDSPFTDLGAWLPELAPLAGRLGTFAILGNHDRTSGADRVAAALEHHTSWRVLRDTTATVTANGARLHLLGLEDRVGPAPLGALAGLVARVPADAPAILLCHHPRAFPEAARAGVPLVLAGHTHGGQVALPGLPELNPARLLMTPYWGGWFEAHGTRMHVSRGVGTSGQRVRIAAPAELTVVTLRAAGDPA